LLGLFSAGPPAAAATAATASAARLLLAIACSTAFDIGIGLAGGCNGLSVAGARGSNSAGFVGFAVILAFGLVFLATPA
jgi:hypothetical protein